ncbi:MAG: MATE family efflux transporter, partial [Bacillota bacterium]|nr:MATE family efflux transporter [Bacillota bacterium]
MEENVKIELDSKGRNLENPMGYAPLFPLIMKMSLPSIFAMLITALYNIVDSIYVARLSEDALSAVSLVYPIQLLVIAISVGTGVGLLSLVSRRLGEKRLDDAENAVNHGLILANLEYIIFLLFGIFGSAWFCQVFSSDPSLVEPATAYCTIVNVGSIFLFNELAFDRSMQACGNMVYAMFAQVAGSVTNIVLDPIMIFGLLGCPALGVAGAAYATVIGQFVAMVVSFVLFNFTKKFPIKLHLKDFKFDWQVVKDIYQVALPAMVMQSITAVTTMAQNKILIEFSSTAVAVLGAYFKLQSFAFMPVLGLNQGVMPIMGYNYGAKNKKRLLNTLK